MRTTNNYAVVDIETVASDRAPIYYQNKPYAAPSNYKDPAKIESYIMERRHEDSQRAALSWWTGKVICLTVKSMTRSFPVMTWVGDDETKILKPFFDLLTADPSLQLIGKNADSFDRPFLIGRAMALNLGLPTALRHNRPIGDVNDIFGFSAHQNQRGRLADYAFGLNLKPKLADGSDVAGMYTQAILGNAQKWTDIALYCAQDVEITAEILERYFKPYVAQMPAHPKQPGPDVTAPMDMDGVFNA